jgi:signal transduction histidine kinase
LTRFWPKRLGTQIALLVAVALLVAQGINFALLLQSSQRQMFIQTSTLAIARLAESIDRADGGPLRAPRQRIVETTASPIATAADQRADVAERARELLGEAGISVRAVHAAEVPAREFRVQTDMAGRALRQAAIQQRTALVVSAEIAPGRWITSAAPYPERDGRVIGWLLFQTMVLYGFVLLPVLWIGGRLARPLDELRRAAEGFTSSAPVEPIVEQGPDDIRELIAAFNLMRTRIVSMLDEKDRMLGAIGHDLRTPLASLRVRTELVDDDAERARMAETIDDMNRTLDDILSLARLGRPSEAESRVDLAALVDSVIEDFRDIGADVTLEDADRVTVPMRRNLIQRAIRNLIENAIKYGARARVRLVPDERGVAIEIDDDGPGIADADIERMFEPFTRLDESRSRDTGGAGLGLALARAIVAGHGGRLVLANRDGGLRATLWLPRA